MCGLWASGGDTVPAYSFSGFGIIRCGGLGRRGLAKLGISLGLRMLCPGDDACFATRLRCGAFAVGVVAWRGCVSLSLGWGCLRDGRCCASWLLPCGFFAGFWAWSFGRGYGGVAGELFRLADGRISPVGGGSPPHSGRRFSYSMVYGCHYLQKCHKKGLGLICPFRIRASFPFLTETRLGRAFS